MYATGRRGLGDASTGTAIGAAAGTVVPGLGTVAGGLLGGLLGGLGIGGHYTGPSVQAGLLSWASQGRWDILQRIASTGKGPHWSQPDKYPDPPGITYGGTIGAGSAGPGIPPQSLSTQQFAAWLIQQYGPRTSSSPTGSALALPDSVTNAVANLALPAGIAGAAAAPAPAVQAGMSPLLTYGLVGAAAWLAYKALGRPRRRNAPRRRHRRR
jgi:hypothetical protein